MSSSPGKPRIERTENAMNDQPPAEQNDVQLNAVVLPAGDRGMQMLVFMGYIQGYNSGQDSVTESYLRSQFLHNLQQELSESKAWFLAGGCSGGCWSSQWLWTAWY